MKRFSALLLSFVLLLFSICPPIYTGAASYNDGFTLIGDVAIPFSEYMPGSFFTENGSACTCHTSSVDCVSNGSDCNCMRYVTIDGKKIDLLSVQCIGFARYCFYRLFGFIDHKDINPDKFYNAGSIDRGSVTASSVKALFDKLKPGAHIRFRLSSSQHSVILLSKNSEGFTVYQANAGGNNVDSKPCIVSTKTYTWQSFADYAYRGIVFANMPTVYPAKYEYLSQSPHVGYSVGDYTTTDNLRLRAGAGTDYEGLDIIPKGTVITVTEIDGEWGKTIYDGKEGWVCLKYASFNEKSVVLDSLKPIEGSGITVKDGFVYGVAAKTTAEQLFALFENEGLSVSGDQRYIGSGTLLSLTDAGINKGSVTIIVSGDTNGDGIHSSGDYIIYKSVLNGSTVPDEVLSKTADMDGDGEIATFDYIFFKKLLTDKA